MVRNSNGIIIIIIIIIIISRIKNYPRIRVKTIDNMS